MSISFAAWRAAAVLLALLGPAVPALAEETPAVPAATAPADAPVEAPAAGVDANAPVMSDARMVGDQKRTRFVADLSANIDMTVFTLPDPYRIVIDLPEISFRLPEGTGEEGRGLVSAFRFGLISPGKSRIVIDAKGPVSVDKEFVVPAAGDQPARIVIDVVPTTRKAFLDASRAYREKQAAAVAAERDRELVVPEKPAGSRLTIVLDPGHGGIDLGTHGSTGTDEKVITLGFAKLLGDKLEKTGLYDVLYTRTDDTFVALGDRVAFARAHHADLFLSIHANSFPEVLGKGYDDLHGLRSGSDKMVAAIAATENQSDALAGVDVDRKDSTEVKDILLDLTRRETRNFGVVFARNLVESLKGSTRMFKVPPPAGRLHRAGGAGRASAMIELGFVTNAADEKLLLSDEWRDKAADSVVDAVAGYFKTHVAGGPMSALPLVAERSRDGATWRRKPGRPTLITKAPDLRHSTNHPYTERIGFRRIRDADDADRRPGNAHDMILRIIGYLFGIGAVFFLVIATGLAWYVSNLARDLPDYDKLAQYEPPVMTRVHAADGQLVAEYAHERRLYLPIQAIPDRLKAAFISAEDKNFYQHSGLDYYGIARALIQNVEAYGSGQRLVGASTITQQVAKNFLLTNDQTMDRKVKEAVLALRIEQAYNKDKILELYMNEIFLGLGAYGVAAASLQYFDKSVHELTLAESAYLAALPKGPNNYNPSAIPTARSSAATGSSTAWSRTATPPRRKVRTPRSSRSASRRARPGRTSSRPIISPRKYAAS